MSKVVEYRGVDNLVAAEVTNDGDAYETGEVFPVAPVAEISKTTETGSETKYYDNLPALVINSEGSDEIELTVALPDLATYAKLVGKEIDTATGAMIDGEREPKYYALGYRFKKTDGTYRYVWRLKGMFGIPDETSATEDDGTDSNNMELVYTGISTSHKFTKSKKPAKAVVIDDTPTSKADISAFFTAVTTPDNLKAKGA
ncbi:major tail protein [Allobaculum stercoricanis]|uniref:major tail protein n=1 Tax=Allobaculum stercoricanis TaxID=174709 RepID=UPI0029434D62|nr:major tail protein [Allobaculum stercoricanis]